MPPRVYRGHGAYEWHPKGGGSIRLCSLDSPRSKVWEAYENAYRRERQPEKTFRAMWAAYKSSQDFQVDLATETRRSYEQFAKMPLEVFGDALPNAITPEHMQAYRKRRGKRVITNREISLIKTLYNWGIPEGWATDNPVKGKLYTKEEPSNRYPTDEEYLIVYLRAPTVIKVAMDLAYLLGARRHDVLDMRWEQVLERGIYIRQHKNGKEQVKTWTTELRAAIDLARTLPASDYLVPGHNGKRYVESTFKDHFIRTVNAALDAGELKERFSFHSLKAKSISDYKGDKLAFSGHSSESMMRRYDRLVPEVPALGNVVKLGSRS